MQKPPPAVSLETAMRWLWDLRMAGYPSALEVEERWLRLVGTPSATINENMSEWRGALARWRDAMLDPGRNGCVAGWGAAASEAVTPSLEARIFKLAEVLVPEPRGASVTHGSSVTGYMGCFDRAWSRAIGNIRNVGGITRAEIITIPLRWMTDDVRETAAKNGDPKFRCPPHLLVSDRTELFGLCRPKMFLIAPGGLGTRFELYWALLAAQLRAMLLTCFTGNGRLPEIFLLDDTVEVDGVNMWNWDGLLLDTRIQVASKTFKQSHIQHVSVLRVGEGEDYVDDNRKGFAVRHFSSDDSLANFVGERYDIQCKA